LNTLFSAIVKLILNISALLALSVEISFPELLTLKTGPLVFKTVKFAAFSTTFDNSSFDLQSVSLYFLDSPKTTGAIAFVFQGNIRFSILRFLALIPSYYFAWWQTVLCIFLMKLRLLLTFLWKSAIKTTTLSLSIIIRQTSSFSEIAAS
jgi:hypothetical protein